MDIKDYLYTYVAEDRAGTRKNDSAYQAALAERNRMQQELIAALTLKQRRMFHEYMEQENFLFGLEQRRLFREPLSLPGSLLTAQRPAEASIPLRTEPTYCSL